MEKLTLNFRRGGGWELEPGFWFRLEDGKERPELVETTLGWITEPNCSYAGPRALEMILEPDPEPLLIPGFNAPDVDQLTDDKWIVHCHFSNGTWLPFPLRIHGATRRAAIEAYNAAAKVMGGK